MLYLKVSFYGANGRRREWSRAFAEYEQRSWDFLAGYRTQLSKAGALVSEEVYSTLRQAYHDMLITADRTLYRLVDETRRRNLTRNLRDRWREFYDYLFGAFTERIDGMLMQLAQEIRAQQIPKRRSEAQE